MKAKKYPLFEPDQVLTSNHLNMMVTYLEEQDRLSRNKLHGIGVVCGLNVARTVNRAGLTSAIRISKGAGLTSAGFLIHLEEASCASFRVYNDPAGYGRWLKGEKQVQLLEILTTADVEALDEDVEVKPLSDLDESKMQQLAVVLYLETLDVDLKNCTPDDCNDKGQERHFHLRKLLVPKQHLRQLIAVECGLEPDSSEASLDAHINMRHHMRELRLQPFRPPLLNEVQVEHIAGQYSLRIRQAVPAVSAAVVSMLELHRGILANEDINTDPAINLQQKLFDHQSQLVQTNAPALQYLYDHLFDLRDGYEELRQKSYELASACCPDGELFPFHLMIGEVVPREDCLPTIYRHHFISAPYHNNQGNLRREIAGQLRRMLLLIEGFQVPAVQEIIITPGQDVNKPLSQRAIPYYYNNVNGDRNLYRHWNQQFHRPCEHEMNRSYHSALYADKVDMPTRDQLLAPLKYDLNGFEFFRVEGHIGKPYTGVLRNITQQQQLYNLPFDVVAVKLGKYHDEVILSDFEFYFHDLEAEYKLMREEMQCFADKTGGYFLNLKYTPAKVEETPATTRPVASFEAMPMFSAIAWTGETKTISKTTRTVITEKKIGTITNRAMVFNFAEDTVGDIFKKEIAKSREQPQELLIAELAKNFTGLLKIPTDALVSRVQYPLLLAKALDELESTLKTAETIRQLNIDALSSDYQKLIRTAEQYKISIRRNLKNPNLKPLGNEEEIINRLEDIIYRCTIKRFHALRAEYDSRVKKLSEQFLFHNFARRHPGMEHRGGVPRGGTLVLVYFDQATYRPPRVQLPGVNVLSRAPEINELSLAARPATLASGFEAISREFTDSGRDISSLSSGSTLSAANLASLFPGNINLNLPILDITRFTNKVVVADFCLDYICSSLAPPVSYVFPPAADTDIVLALPRNQFCSNDNTDHPFTVNPAGGELKGPGVVNRGGAFFFNPAKSKIEGGQASFQYEVNGRSASLSVVVEQAPKLSFVDEVIERTPNGLVVSMRNESESGEQFIWELAGENVMARDLNITLPDFRGDTIAITLRGLSGQCGNALTREFRIESGVEETVLFEPNGRTAFCFNDPNTATLVARPDGGRIKATAGITLKESANGFTFEPSRTNPGSYKITYTVPGGSSAELTIEIVQPNAAFTVKPIRASGNIIQVHLIPEMQDADSYDWHIGGQVVSSEQQPRLALDFSNAHSLEAGLRVVKAGCTATHGQKANRDVLLRELGTATGPAASVEAGKRAIAETLSDMKVALRTLSRPSIDPRILSRAVLTTGTGTGTGTRTSTGDNTNTVLKQNAELLEAVEKDIGTAAALKKLVAGSRNQALGKALSTLLNGTVNEIAKTGNQQALNSQWQGLYRLQVELAINLMAIQEKDLANNDPMLPLFGRIAAHVKSLLQKRINLNANGTLRTQLMGSVETVKHQANVLKNLKQLIETTG